MNSKFWIAPAQRVLYSGCFLSNLSIMNPMNNCYRFLLVFSSLVFSIQGQAQWFDFSINSMTTRVDLEFWLDGDLNSAQASAKKLSETVFNEFNRIDERMSRYRDDSELSEVNRMAASKNVLVSSELLSVLEKAQQVSRLSAGAFDMTFSSVGYLYDLRASVQPTQSIISANLPAINYQNVLLNTTARTVSFKEKGVLIDLGGIAKGYAVDQGIVVLKKAGIQHARLSAGGDMYLLGDKRGTPWIVGIKDPRPVNKATTNETEESVSKFVGALPLFDVAISTSGDYERFFIDEAGQRIHHILSPKTGRPAKGIQSVTVIGPDTTTTDGLSTAIFVLGVKEGLALVERLAGIDVIIIDDQRRFHYSTGLMQPGVNN